MTLQKINWGWRIAIVYSGFVVLMLFMVYQSTQMKAELVTPDYYAEELQYQTHIDKVNRTSKLGTALQWKVNDGNIQFTFPDEVKASAIAASVYFYCPSDSKRDATINVQAMNGVAQLSTQQLTHGTYQMKVEWRAAGSDYFNEGTISIQ